jgi:predicted enzyme related to lactoylglutathione lyase
MVLSQAMAKAKRPVRELGMISHSEIASTDPVATKKFLEEVFRWDFTTVKTPAGERFSFHAAGGADGSVRKTRSGELPASINYVLVKDLRLAEGEVKKKGGEIVLPRVDVPQMGSFFWFKVPGGPVLACWQDAPDRAG